eukprot:PRCOL_00003146-RA
MAEDAWMPPAKEAGGADAEAGAGGGGDAVGPFAVGGGSNGSSAGDPSQHSGGDSGGDAGSEGVDWRIQLGDMTEATIKSFTPQGIKRVSTFSERSLFVFTKGNPVRVAAMRAIVSKLFDNAILLLILLNCITLAMGSNAPNFESSRLGKFLAVSEWVFTPLFVIEMMLKVLGMGFFLGKGAYLRDPWNVMDFLVVLLGIIASSGLIGNYTSIRTVRVLRPLRTLTSVEGLRKLVVTLMSSLPMLGNVLLLCGFLFFILGIVGIQSFAERMRNRCGYEGFDTATGLLTYVLEDPEGDLCSGPMYPMPLEMGDYEERDLAALYAQHPHLCSEEALAYAGGAGGACEWLEVIKAAGGKAKDVEAAREAQWDLLKDAGVVEGPWEGLDEWGKASYSGRSGAGRVCPRDGDGVQLTCVRGENPKHNAISFDNILWAWLTIFTCVSMEGWTDVMYDLQDGKSPWVWIYFLFLIIVGSFYAINLALAVLYLYFTRRDDDEEAESAQDNAGDKKVTSDAKAFDNGGRMPGDVPVQSSSKLVRTCQSIVEHESFMYVIVALIVINTIVMAAEFDGMPDAMFTAFDAINYILTAAFAVEMVLKITALGPGGYRKDPMNVFDGVIVVLSIVEIVVTLASGSGGGGMFSVLRAFRLLRVFKLARSWKELNSIITTVFRSVASVTYLSLILVLFIFVFALLGMQLFGYRYEFCDDGGQMCPPGGAVQGVPAFLSGGGKCSDHRECYASVDDAGVACASKFDCTFGLATEPCDVFLAGDIYAGLNTQQRATVTFSPDVASLVSDRRADGVEGCMMFAGEKDGDGDVFEIAAMRYVGRPYRPRHNFDDVYWSIITIFQVLTGENWNEVMYDGIAKGDANSIPRSQSFSDKPGGPSLRRLLSESNASNASQTERSIDELLSSLVPEANSLFVFPPDNAVRVACARVVSHNKFELGIIAAILISSMLLALDSNALLNDNSSSGKALRAALFGLDVLFVALFAVEMVLKVITMGFVAHKDAYLRNGWNVLDFLIVIVGVVGLAASGGALDALRALRTFRALRPLRMASRATGIKVIVNALFKAIPAIGNVLLVCALFYLIFGILGLNLLLGRLRYCGFDCGDDIWHVAQINGMSLPDSFGNGVNAVESPAAAAMVTHAASLDYYNLPTSWNNRDKHFDNIFASILTLFEMATLEMFLDTMYQGIDSTGSTTQPIRDTNPALALYFASFIIIGSFFVMNLFVGVTIDKFNEMKHKSDDGVSVFLSSEQQAWVNIQRIISGVKPLVRLSPPDGEWRARTFHVVQSDAFDGFIMSCIMANIVFMSMRTADMTDEWVAVLFWANFVFTTIFFLEMVFKIWALGPRNYFGNPWNKFDFVVVQFSIIGLCLDAFTGGGIPVVSLLRVFRVARIFRLVPRAKGLKTLFHTLLFSLPALVNVGSVLLLFFFIYSIMGMNLFGSVRYGENLNRYANFRDFPAAMMTLFRMATGESWNGIMWDAMVTQECHSLSEAYYQLDYTMPQVSGDGTIVDVDLVLSPLKCPVDALFPRGIAQQATSAVASFASAAAVNAALEVKYGADAPPTCEPYDDDDTGLRWLRLTLADGTICERVDQTAEEVYFDSSSPCIQMAREWYGSRAVENRCTPWEGAAILYFSSFVVVCALIVLNLVIGVILDEIIASSDAETLPVVPAHMDRFIEVWQELDTEGSYFIKRRLLPKLITRLEPPLGIRGTGVSSSTLMSMLRHLDISVHNGKINFHETLYSLAARVAAHPLPTTVEQEVRIKILKKLDYFKVSAQAETEYTAGHYHAAEYVQAAVRGFLTRYKVHTTQAERGGVEARGGALEVVDAENANALAPDGEVAARLAEEAARAQAARAEDVLAATPATPSGVLPTLDNR